MQIEKYEEQTETRQAVKQVKRTQVPDEQTWDMADDIPSMEA